MRIISLEKVKKEVERLFLEIAYFLPEDVVESLEAAYEREESETGRAILSRILENQNVAREQMLPLCQDTSHAIVFVEVGEEVVFDGTGFYDAIDEGIRRAYSGYLRKSIVGDPLRRKNTNDNTPVFLQTDIVKGDKLKIVAAAKGFGSENMSAFRMFLPHEGFEAVEKFVLGTVEEAGSNPCPPIVVGIVLEERLIYAQSFPRRRSIGKSYLTRILTLTMLRLRKDSFRLLMCLGWDRRAWEEG